MSDVVDHVGIRVSDLRASRRMYQAALAELGLSVLGEGVQPGLRPEYSGHCFAAFIIDPDGNNVETVFHKPSANMYRKLDVHSRAELARILAADEARAARA